MLSKQRASRRVASALYIAPSSTALVRHLRIENYHLPWRQASESASDVPSCSVRYAAAARQTNY
jgi:hypothetical protein